jgi:hypothetical protein
MRETLGRAPVFVLVVGRRRARFRRGLGKGEKGGNKGEGKRKVTGGRQEGGGGRAHATWWGGRGPIWNVRFGAVTRWTA